MKNMIYVGKYKEEFNKILGISLGIFDIYRSSGLPTHMVNRKHYIALKYIDSIPDIINNPDYIGINPNENGDSIELVKVFKNNIILGIKLDKSNNTYYISTMFDIPTKKINRFLYSGRFKKYIDIDKEMIYDLDTENVDSDEQEKVPCAPEMEPDMVDDSPPTQN